MPKRGTGKSVRVSPCRNERAESERTRKHEGFVGANGYERRKWCRKQQLHKESKKYRHPLPKSMKFVITPHARRKRMSERAITELMVQEALDNPTKVGYDGRGRVLVKKRYTRSGRERLLIIAGEMKNDKTFEIVTVIDTSKVKKYL